MGARLVRYVREYMRIVHASVVIDRFLGREFGEQSLERKGTIGCLPRRQPRRAFISWANRHNTALHAMVGELVVA
jgi:hypothetical protein